MKLSSPYIPIILLVISIQLISFNDSPPNGHTGAPEGVGFSPLCSECHSADNGTGYMYICVTTPGTFDCNPFTDNCDFPTTLEPNTTYSIRVVLENCSGGKEKAGFQLVALEGDEHTSNSIGTFSNLGANVTTSQGGQSSTRTYLKHAEGAKSFSSNVITYTADWTSPSEITGSVHFYAAGVIANGNNGTSGDVVVSTSVVTEAPLAAELRSFDVQQLDKQTVKINWETSTESNSDYFEVLRSTNGVDFEPLEKIPAAGFSTHTLSYTFIDKNPIVNQSSFYRLKQVDLTGAFVYSTTKSLEILDVDKNEMIILSNPVQQGSNIVVDFLANQDYPNASLQVFDVTGRVMEDLKPTMSNGLIEGFNKIMVETTNLPEGIYFLNVHDGRAVLANQTVVVTQ